MFSSELYENMYICIRLSQKTKRRAATVTMLIAVTHLFRWWAADSGTLFARFPNLDMLTGGAVIMPRIFSPCARSSRIVRRGRAAQPSRQLC